jgi:hypothetical protein
MEQDFAVIRIEQSHGQTVDEFSEVYTVKSKIGKPRACSRWVVVCALVCLERQLGRMLGPNDFMPNHPFNRFPGTERLLVTAAIRRAIEDDRFPHAPRLDPLRAALGKFEAAPEPTPLPKAPPPAKVDKRARR